MTLWWFTGASFELTTEEYAARAIRLIYLIQFQWINWHWQQRFQSIPFLHQSNTEQAAKVQQYNWQLHDSIVTAFRIYKKCDEMSFLRNMLPRLDTQSKLIFNCSNHLNINHFQLFPVLIVIFICVHMSHRHTGIQAIDSVNVNNNSIRQTTHIVLIFLLMHEICTTCNIFCSCTDFRVFEFFFVNECINFRQFRNKLCQKKCFLSSQFELAVAIDLRFRIQNFRIEFFFDIWQ